MYHLGKLKWVMEISLTRTLAAKHKLSVSQVREKYGAKLTVQGKEYKVLQASAPREGKPPLVATWGSIPLKRNMQAALEEKTPRLWNNRTELVQRLLADFCELCESSTNTQDGLNQNG
jgi:Type II intron maturase